jgi:DNA repair protein RAD5
MKRFISKFASRLDLSSADAPSVAFIENVAEELRTRNVKSSSSGFFKAKENDAEADEPSECVICLSPYEHPVLLPCGHVFCRECLSPLCNERGAFPCPHCRKVCNQSDAMAVPQAAPRIEIDFKTDWKHSAKTQQLLAQLAILRQEQPDSKAIVFSQWTQMLDLCEVPLRMANLSFVRLDGTMTPKAREAVLHKFKTDAQVGIFLISLKAGGVGLNLVSANVVYFLDCWWNPAVEDQAIQRVHRIGQTKEVLVYRFLVRDTVEERIMDLQARKRSLASSLGLDNPTSGGDANKLSMSDLTSLFSMSRTEPGFARKRST